jgi:hypothetical protein
MRMGQEMTMAGGGKIQQSEPNRDILATPVPYLQNTQPATIPAFMPGQREALAAQLSAGFGSSTGSGPTGPGSPAGFASYLNQIYGPAQTLTFMPGPLKPTTPTTGGGKKPVVNGKPVQIRRNTFGANSR